MGELSVEYLNMRLITALILASEISSSQIFQSRRQASQHLNHYRARRDNNGIFEELKDPDLTRECIDEVCGYNEVLEALGGKGHETAAKEWYNSATKMCQIKTTSLHENNDCFRMDFKWIRICQES